MWEDGFQSSHPIVANISTANDIIANFDKIPIEKAGAVLRMLESIVGETVLQNGLKV